LWWNRGQIVVLNRSSFGAKNLPQNANLFLIDSHFGNSGLLRNRGSRMVL
jgi:hypothetical protein